MKRCKNCGQQVLATSDWACPQCGYPLLEATRMEKSFSEVLQERRSGITKRQSAQNQHPLDINIYDLDTEELCYNSESESAPEVSNPAPTQTACNQHAVWVDTDQSKDLDSQGQPELIQEPPSEQLTAMETTDDNQPVEMIKLTVDALIQEFSQNDIAAGDKYHNRILILQGSIAMLNLRETREVQYLMLAGSEQNACQSVRCSFNNDNAWALREMQNGQQVTVKGRFRGSLTAMNLLDSSIHNTD